MGPDNNVLDDAHARAFRNHIMRLREAELKGEPMSRRSADEVEQDLLGTVDEEAKKRIGRPRKADDKSEESEG